MKDDVCVNQDGPGNGEGQGKGPGPGKGKGPGAGKGKGPGIKGLLGLGVMTKKYVNRKKDDANK